MSVTEWGMDVVLSSGGGIGCHQDRSRQVRGRTGCHWKHPQSIYMEQSCSEISQIYTLVSYWKKKRPDLDTN